MTIVDLRALLAKATHDQESMSAKAHGAYSDVTLPGKDLVALLDVAEAAKNIRWANSTKELDAALSRLETP